jgi:hypothetical protein
MNNKIYELLAAVQEEYEKDILEEVIENLYLEEDLMQLANPRNFGPDWDDE